MAVDMFLKIEPGVTGEATSKGFEKQIDIMSFSWGAHNASSVGTGTGSGAGKVSVSSLSIQKVVDTSTATLFVTCAAGKHFDTATLTVREAGGDSPVVFLKYVMKQVYIDSISWGAAGGGGKPSESVSLSFANIQMTYQAQDAKGLAGSPQVTGWDIQKNTKL